jgi:hypothetical protein
MKLNPIYVGIEHHPTLSCAVWTHLCTVRLVKPPRLLPSPDVTLLAYRRGTTQTSRAQRGTRSQRNTVQCTTEATYQRRLAESRSRITHNLHTILRLFSDQFHPPKPRQCLRQPGIASPARQLLPATPIPAASKQKPTSKKQ